MEIQVKVISQFGNRRVFPVDRAAALFCQIAGTATLTDQAIAAIKELGYKVVVVPDEPTEL